MMTVRRLTTIWCAVMTISAMAAEPNRAETAPANATPAEAKKTDKPAPGKAAAKPANNSQLGMSVTGTQEAPKVLYIVPWKTLDAVPAEPYVSGLMDEVFSPVDPVVFERSVNQHEQIQAGAAPASAEK